MITEEKVREVLKEVIEPEVGINLVDMDLIKEIEIKEGEVKVKMTLTTPEYPMANYLVEEVKKKIESLKEVHSVEVHLV